jgi:hypothetical protein
VSKYEVFFPKPAGFQWRCHQVPFSTRKGKLFVIDCMSTLTLEGYELCFHAILQNSWLLNGKRVPIFRDDVSSFPDRGSMGRLSPWPAVGYAVIQKLRKGCVKRIKVGSRVRRQDALLKLEQLETLMSRPSPKQSPFLSSRHFLCFSLL